MKQSITFVLLFFLLSIGLRAQHLLKGKFTDEMGEPMVGASVELLLNGNHYLSALTDLNGHYQLKNIPTNAYDVRFKHLYSANEVLQSVFIHADTTLDCSLRLTYDLSSVTVSAVRASERDPLTYTNVTKAELVQDNIGQDVPYLLKNTASAVVTSDAGAGIGYTGIRIRGSDPSRTNVTINGIPLNDSESQQVYWVNLPDFAASTDAMQVQRGVGSSTNGAGAFGATINLQTTHLKPKPYADLATTFGSFNTRKLSASLGTGLLKGRFGFDGRYSTITSDGYIDRASSKLNAYALSGIYLGSNHSLRLNVFSGHETTYQAWFGIDAATLANDRTYNPAGLRLDGTFYDNQVDNYQQTHYQAIYNHNLFGIEGNLSLHYTKGKGFYEEYKTEETLADYNIANAGVEKSDLIRQRWLSNDFYGLVYSFAYNFKENTKLTLGGAWNTYDGEHYGKVIWSRYFGTSELGHTYYYNDAKKNDANTFLKLSHTFQNKWNTYLDLQYRLLSYRFTELNGRVDLPKSKVNLAFFNPKLGFSYLLPSNQQGYAYFGVGHREPNRNDYTESSSNSRPKPERLYNIEMGYKKKWKEAELKSNLYLMFYKDQLALTGQINDVGEYTRINLKQSHRLGLEVEGIWQPLANGFWCEGNIAISQNKINTWTEYLDNWNTGLQESITHQNTDLAFSPSVVGSLEIGYDFLKTKARGGSLALVLSNKYVGQQFIDNTSNKEASLKAFTHNDFKVIYTKPLRQAREVSVQLSVMNIFNYLYENNGWAYHYIIDGQPNYLIGYYPQAGRHFMVSMRFGI